MKYKYFKVLFVSFVFILEIIIKFNAFADNPGIITASYSDIDVIKHDLKDNIDLYPNPKCDSPESVTSLSNADLENIKKICSNLEDIKKICSIVADKYTTIWRFNEKEGLKFDMLDAISTKDFFKSSDADIGLKAHVTKEFKDWRSTWTKYFTNIAKLEKKEIINLTIKIIKNETAIATFTEKSIIVKKGEPDTNTPNRTKIVTLALQRVGGSTNKPASGEWKLTAETTKNKN